jgi:ankyrin repeat protein
MQISLVAFLCRFAIVIALSFCFVNAGGIPVEHSAEQLSSAARGCSEPQFRDAPHFPTLTAPKDIATADFDGDDRADIAAIGSSNNVSIHRNTNNGNLAAAVNLITGNSPQVITVADFDLDGKADIATSNFNAVSVFRNTSAGPGNISFGPRVDILGVGPETEAIIAGDLDGDQKPEIVTANRQGNNFSILGNNGAGPGSISFAAPVNLATSSLGQDARIGDFDGDGRPDIVTLFSNGTVSVLKNATAVAGSFNFAAKVDFSLGSGTSPRSLVAADFDSDGRLDIAATLSFAAQVGVLRNVSSGAGNLAFAAPTKYTVGAGPIPLIAVDLNGDGKIDLAAANNNVNNVSILQNASIGPGSISFLPQAAFGAGNSPYSMVSADFNGDGRPDIATSDLDGATITVLINSGKAAEPVEFMGRKQIVLPSSPAAVAIADFDGDGERDLVIADPNRKEMGALRNTGNARFPEISRFTAGTKAGGIGLADFDGDGKIDVAVSSSDFQSFEPVLIYRNSSSPGTMAFSVATTYTPVTGAGDILAADFDGDGRVDLATANVGSNSISIVRNLSSGPGNFSFSFPINVVVGPSPARIVAADFDGDSKLDIAAGSGGSRYVAVMRNVGTAQEPVSFSGSIVLQNIDFSDVGAGDLDGDGKADLVVATSDTINTWILRNLSTGPGQISFSAGDRYIFGIVPERVVVADLNLDGRPDVFAGNGALRGVYSIVENTTTTPGTISLATKLNQPSSGAPEFALGDLNDDGIPDAVLAGPNLLDTLLSQCKATNSNFDFDGDGKADLSVRRPSDNVWYFLRTTAGYTGLQYGEAGDLMAPADYDGDGKTDVAVFRPSTGTWFVAATSAGFYTDIWGANGDLPVPADYNGDGKADIAVYRPSDGTWYRKLSSGVLSIVQFGTPEDKPQIGDFDGDGRTDLAVLRPSNNTWYFLRTTAGFTAMSWGADGDRASPADYDGDGKTDVAVFRPSTGVWFIAASSGGFSTRNWGAVGDVPVTADYDGDGKADTAVFRPSNNNWYLFTSTSGIAQYQFGAAGDRPVPSVFNY